MQTLIAINKRLDRASIVGKLKSMVGHIRKTTWRVQRCHRDEKETKEITEIFNMAVDGLSIVHMAAVGNNKIIL